MRQLLPIFAPLRTMAPMPMRVLSPTVQPWRMALCPHGDVVAHGDGVAVVHVHHAVVLNVGAGTDGDVLVVSAEDGTEKNAAVGSEGHAAPEGGVVRHKGGGMDDRFFHGCTS